MARDYWELWLERGELGMDFTGCLCGFLGEVGIFSDGYERVWGEIGVVVGRERGKFGRLVREIIGFGRKFYDGREKCGFLVNFM